MYKFVGTDSRQYIDDGDRPAEIARLQKIIVSSCSADPDARRSEETEAAHLHIARRAVDDDGVAGLDQARDVGNVADRRDAERAGDDGDVTGRAAVVEH